jgi:hypothetical protein
MLNIEDDLEDTILPRFRLAGGDKTKLYYIRGKWVIGRDTAVERGIALLEDMERLRNVADEIPGLGAIFIDPITNYLGSAKMVSEENVRSVLTPLATFAADKDIVAVIVGHFNRRDKGTDPLYRCWVRPPLPAWRALYTPLDLIPMMIPATPM